MSKHYRVVALPGEGIGIEVMAAALPLLHYIAQQQEFTVQIESGLIGKAAVEQYGEPFPEATALLCQQADGILLGAVAQGGLLELRQQFDFFANLRPIRPFPALLENSPLKPEYLSGVDILFVRELVGGIYFGASARAEDEAGRYGYHTMQYHDWEIRRIAKVALEQAQKRRKLLTIAHKENALPHILWRQLVSEVATAFPDVTINSMLADNLAMQLVMRPQQFDVILASNLLGDILSDIGGALVGSIGLLGSASLNGAGVVLYEPIHGTAPDIAGKGIANPLGMINSICLMLQQWGEYRVASLIEQAEQQLLAKGYRTLDLISGETQVLMNTKECVWRLIAEIEQL
jgi:3-isopropylmalate dehydrogenase/3-benzylmalate dehydrogenase